MSAAAVFAPVIAHRIPGRLRLKTEADNPTLLAVIVQRLRGNRGVRSATADPLTGSIVINFDPQLVEESQILSIASAPIVEKDKQAASESHLNPPREEHSHSIIHEGLARRGAKIVRRVRIAVRGVDRSGAVARRVVERLKSHPGVHAEASPLTGRVLIEFDEDAAKLRDLLTVISDVELPSVPGEDNPSHPLDPAPLQQSSIRAGGAAVGLGLIAAQRMMESEGPILTNPAWAYAGALFNVAQSFPWVRKGVRSTIGRNAGDLALGIPEIALSALVGSPLSLLVNGVGALRLSMTAAARRQSWREYEERLGDASKNVPGATIRLESGDLAPMPALVVEGSGTATESDGLATHFVPGDIVSSGAKLGGHGPFVLELQDTPTFEPMTRPAEPKAGASTLYHDWNAPISLLFSTALGLATRSAGRAFEAFLCLSPRAATAGTDAAHLNATARIIRGGSVVVGTRTSRRIELPNTLIIESARILTDGLEIVSVNVMEPGIDDDAALNLAATVSHACGSLWGDTFGLAPFPATGSFEHGTAKAKIDGTHYTLELGLTQDHHRAKGHQAFILSEELHGISRRLAVFAVRPRISAAVSTLAETCQKNRINLVILAPESPEVASQIALRAGVKTVQEQPIALIRALQEKGERVAYVSDGALGAEPFEQCDLAIGMTTGRSGQFSARADVLAPDITALCSIMEAGAITAKVKRESVGLGIIANIVGAALCVLGPTGIVGASRAVYLATLATYANAAYRFRGGDRQLSYTDLFADPKPEERWGKREIEEVLDELNATADGLMTAEADRRSREHHFAESPLRKKDSAFLRAVGAQLRSPLIGLMAGGAALTLAIGTPVEFALVTTTIVANVLFGAWQEQQVHGASKALARITPSVATVIRDGIESSLPSKKLVPGDVILLSPGDRVPADARVLEAASFEVDEASLTGESLPVAKSPFAPTYSGRIVLEGSDVIVGRAKCVVVAVGRKTRIGSIAAAISKDERTKSPLNNRLAQLLKQFLPIAAGAGAIVFLAGLAQGRPVMPELVLAVTLALSAIPEGLPLLAGVAEVAVASRLSKRGAFLRRLGASEALGRVDVACTDKTGTLTQGKLILGLVATTDRVSVFNSSEEFPEVSDELKAVILAAALASPHPDSSNVRAHPTDMAVLEGAYRLGLASQVNGPRDEEAPFEPTRSFHACRSAGRVLIKGAPEAVVTRCTRIRTESGDLPVDASERDSLLREAEQIAGRGMRVLMVAESDSSTTVEDPQNLTVLGFLGIRDPLKPGAKESVARCRLAGVRVMILTGDHPATAKAIANEVGLETLDSNVLTGSEMAGLSNEAIDERLKRVTVVARVTPLDKLRIVESLQRMGHVVAMTGDGVNDAPALRLSDVGIAMGRGGTEVARQAADLVLGDDDFTTLVEALVEGRGFWRNIRRTLGLLLGGILGELGFVAIATAIGLPAPLNTRQILTMNLITFGLPTLAVALQEPEHRNLAGLAREGASALEKPLRNDVIRRANATIIPSLLAYVLALPLGGVQAQTVAFAVAIGSQLAQTVDSGHVETGLTKSVVGAVGTSFGLVVASLFVPQLRALLSLAIPTLPAVALILIASCSAPLVARAFKSAHGPVRMRAPSLAMA